MNEDEIKGKLHNIKGRVKEAAGAITGDKKTQAEGLAERVGGAVREKVGEVKREIKRDSSDDDETDK